MSIAPGWYKDPAEPTTQRWWDGEGWVGDPLPADQEPPPGPPPPSAPASVEPEPPAPAAPDPAAEFSDQQRTRAGQQARSRPQPRFRVPPPPYPGAPRLTPNPHGYRPAGLGTRLLARLVDIGLVLALNVVVNGWFVYQYWQEVSPVIAEAWRRSLAGESMSDLPQVGDQAGWLQLVILILAAALWLAYEVPAVANTGQTPGKRLLRIKVVALEKDQPLSFGRSLRRWNTMGLPVLLWWCFGIGFLLQLADAAFALFDRPLQQALHDKSAHTAVVSIAEPPITPAQQSSEENPDEPDPS